MIFNKLSDELIRTRNMIDKLLNVPIYKRRINHYYSTLLRSEALEQIHQQQVDLLKKWRQYTSEGKTLEADHILFELLRCINAIAGSIGFTG